MPEGFDRSPGRGPYNDLNLSTGKSEDPGKCAQVLVRRRDLRVVEVSGGLAIAPIRGRPIEAPCRLLADGGHRGIDELLTLVFQ